MNLDTIRMVRRIITHKNCADGMASAILLHDALPDVPITFMSYGTEEHRNLPAEPGLLFCDFSPPRERAQEFVAAGALVLDHHATAKAVVDALGPNGVFGDEVTQPGVCGASLAYTHVWLPIMREREQGQPLLTHFAQNLARLAGIRDTWQRHDKDWDLACRQSLMLNFVPQKELLTHLDDLRRRWPQIEWIGETLAQNAAKSVQSAIDEAFRFNTLAGTRVLMFNSLSATSDAAELLGSDVDLVAGFFYKCDQEQPLLICSLRSHTDFDCAAFAKHHGGGGHIRAAGFNVVVEDGDPQPYKMFAAILNKYEGLNTRRT